jgi:CelD/BcsL family acetyltransferase involved in cellulose biosynthesis
MKDEWNNLLWASDANNLFLTWEWVNTWWKVFGDKKKLCVLTVCDDGELIGIGPFYVQTIGNSFKARVLRICSSEELYPDYLDIIAKHGYERDVTIAISSYLEAKTDGWSLMSFNSLLASSNIIRYENDFCNSHMKQIGLSSVCPYIKIDQPYDVYLRKQFRRKKRYNLERQAKLALEKRRLSCEIVGDKGRLPKAMEDLFSLHEKRAAQRKIVSTFISHEVKHFHQLFSSLMLEKDALRLCFLYDGDVPTSALYAFKYNGTMFFYQGGMDPAWTKMSLGSVLMNIVIKQAFDEGLIEFDFLKGDDAYKRSWSNSERRQYRLNLYRKDFTGIFLFMKALLRSYVRNTLPSSLGQKRLSN